MNWIDKHRRFTSLAEAQKAIKEYDSVAEIWHKIREALAKTLDNQNYVDGADIMRIVFNRQIRAHTYPYNVKLENTGNYSYIKKPWPLDISKQLQWTAQDFPRSEDRKIFWKNVHKAI